MEELVPRVRCAGALAKRAGLGFNIDAEEADRLTLSLEVIEACCPTPRWRLGRLRRGGAGLWPRAGAVIDWLHALAQRLDRKIMVRLVKGAYWDAEMKRAQVLGLTGFPVFTRKQATDVSYIANARKLLGDDRPHLSAVRHPQRPYRRRHPAHGAAAQGLTPGPSNSSACTAWANGCTTSS
jgi:RHH-type proline utilization regulon transcriptional repressor/proline dehydrogenase/delta 1-pyrroline-5-carboxylate dehydrogenase